MFDGCSLTMHFRMAHKSLKMTQNHLRNPCEIRDSDTLLHNRNLIFRELSRIQFVYQFVNLIFQVSGIYVRDQGPCVWHQGFDRLTVLKDFSLLLRRQPLAIGNFFQACLLY